MQVPTTQLKYICCQYYVTDMQWYLQSKRALIIHKTEQYKNTHRKDVKIRNHPVANINLSYSFIYR